ncbi:acyltransferase family protein [Desulfovibrio desulfuricans]|uniref:acyltransferase family protein n=1 Tax=Desulfovibrio desulfuricans TaxID=876 RepID=UPI001AE1EC7B|nr:acyltransferase [Desulfovibrio desulfuricans]QTO39618.1 acyltransferase [Desulfovibrio desulfuricans]
MNLVKKIEGFMPKQKDYNFHSNSFKDKDVMFSQASSNKNICSTNDTFSNNSYVFIRSVAVMSILIFHFGTTLTENNINFPFSDLFYKINCGALGVNVFFILSGLLIHKNNTSTSVVIFFKKRIVRILIPQVVAYISIFVCYLLLNMNIIYQVSFSQVLISMFGMDYLGSLGFRTFWLVGEWFTLPLVLSYLMYPILRILLKKFERVTTLIITIIFFCNIKFLFLSNENGAFSLSNAIFMFYLGMLFNEYDAQIKKCSEKTFLLILLIFVVYITDVKNNFYVLKYIVVSILLFMVFSRLAYCPKILVPFSKYSYEIYLLHHRVFIVFMPICISRASNYSLIGLFLLLLVATYICAVSLNSFSSCIKKNIGC